MTEPTHDVVTDGAFSVCVVGSGWMFTSGISHYTLRLSSALSLDHETTVILMRKLVPRWLYPGRARVGRTRELSYPAETTVLNGVDWYWGRSMARALRLLRRRAPQLVVFQWWTAAVLHSYVALAVLARLSGAKVVIEFHETQDVGESDRFLARWYHRAVFPLLAALASGCIVHSEHDRRVIASHGWFGSGACTVVPHGPYDHLTTSVDAAAATATPPATTAASVAYRGDPAPGEVRYLYFGVVRPYKGVQVLAAAVDLLPDEPAFRLTVAGEPWEGFTAPLEALRHGRHADRVTVIDRYLSDQELVALLAGADAVVLPYLRSSASGPLHVAMSWGLPVVVSDVEGLAEVASRYEGAILVAPDDAGALAEGLVAVRDKVGQLYADPVSWEESVRAVEALYHSATPR